MAEANPVRTTASGQGSATVRQRPHLLLMVTRLRTAEATIELGLAKLKAKAEATARLLQRLGAARVETGEPHFDDQTNKDPIAAIQVRTAKALRKRTADDPTHPPERGTNAVLTAAWPIATLTAEETLGLVDRLRFELAEDAEAGESREGLQPWASPEERVMEMMAQIHTPPPDDLAPQFLFVAAAGEEQREKAAAEAFARARRQAETVARAAGFRLGALASVHGGFNGYDVRPDRMMERQRCAALLRGSSYDQDEHEVITDRPQSAEFAVTLNVSYHLEAAAD